MATTTSCKNILNHTWTRPRKKMNGGKNIMRGFLKGLELDGEMVDKIMSEYGKHLNSLKEKMAEYETTINELNSKVETSEKSLKKLQNVTSENESLKLQLKMNNSNVKKEFSEFVTSKIQSLVNGDNDFETVLANYKKENPQYFGDTVIKKIESSPSLPEGGEIKTSTNDIMNDIIRSAKNNN